MDIKSHIIPTKHTIGLGQFLSYNHMCKINIIRKPYFNQSLAQFVFSESQTIKEERTYNLDILAMILSLTRLMILKILITNL